MSYWVSFGKNKIDLSEINSSQVRLEHRPGGWLCVYINIDGVEKLYRTRFSKEKNKISMLLNGMSFNALVGEKSYSGSIEDSQSESILKAQFPGKIRKILVKQGEVVSEDQKLILLEAMKMEFAVQSSYKTKVSKILVKEGDQVSPGTILIELEAIQEK